MASHPLDLPAGIVALTAMTTQLPLTARVATVAAALLLVACGSERPQSAASVPHIMAATTTSPPPATTVVVRASRSRTIATHPSPPSVAVAGNLSALLDRLAMCESHMNPKAIGGGGRFFGAFQFMLRTWRAVSGLGGNPIDFDYETQKAVAARIPVSSWRNQFPACSRRIGVA